MSFETQLSGLHTELKSFVDRSGQKVEAIQRQVDAIDARTQGTYGAGGFASSPGDNELRKAIDESPEFARFGEIGKGVARISLKNLPLEVKTTMTEATVGSGTSGVIMPQRVRAYRAAGTAPAVRARSPQPWQPRIYKHGLLCAGIVLYEQCVPASG